MTIKYGSLTDMLQESREDYTIDGHCSDCGACCSNFLPISDKEVERIRKHIKKHGIKAQVHMAVLAEQTFDMLCPFMDMRREHKCTIYKVRPQICRSFLCNLTVTDALKDTELYSELRPARDVRRTFFGGAK